VTQRGNRRQDIFFEDGDYRAYLAFLAEWAEKVSLRVWSYCLMPNHVHLIVVPADETGLARGVGETHRSYTHRINKREGWIGHLFQQRFSSFVMDEPHLMSAAAYVERNPVRAGLVARAEDWPWSSAPAHVLGRPDPVAEGGWLAERTRGWVCTWGEHLARDEHAETSKVLRNHERSGRPLGSDDFVKTLAGRFGDGVLPKKKGRPRKGPKTGTG